jgi:hypothetical protein
VWSHTLHALKTSHIIDNTGVFFTVPWTAQGIQHPNLTHPASNVYADAAQADVDKNLSSFLSFLPRLSSVD